MGSRIGFFFTEAFRSLSTNKATSIAAIIAMVVSLLLVSIAAYSYSELRNFGEEQQKAASVVKIYLKETVTEAEVNALRAQLEGTDNVQSVSYLSKEDALQRAKELFKDSPKILENLARNPFPASLEATVIDPRKSTEVGEKFTDAAGVSKVEATNEKERKLINVIRIILYIALAIGAGLLLAATVLVSNTIRLSIYARRREIEIMKLVGASNTFVRTPFMIEGVICGVIASFIAILLMFGSVELTQWAWETVFEPKNQQLGATDGKQTPIVLVVLGTIGLGIFLGVAGSITSTRKYLKV